MTHALESIPASRARAPAHQFYPQCTHCYIALDAGGAVLFAGTARIRVREFTGVVALHVCAAAYALAHGRQAGQVWPNVLLMIAMSVVGVMASYTTERRERAALLESYRLGATHAAALRQGALPLVLSRAPTVLVARAGLTRASLVFRDLRCALVYNQVKLNRLLVDVCATPRSRAHCRGGSCGRDCAAGAA